MKEVTTKKAPEAAGPYSQAVVAGGLMFCAGQLGLQPETGNLVTGGIKKETEQVLKNLTAILKTEGVGLDAVTMANVYLQNMSDFKEMNEVYATFFTQDPKPARVTIGVAALPKNALVEISCIVSLSK